MSTEIKDIGEIVIRADASVAMGTGHVMRCLALAQASQDAGARAIFAMAESTSALKARLSAEACRVVSVSAAAATPEDARQTIALAREHRADWLVVDGYQFTADYQCALKKAGLKVLFLDDYGHATHYSADIVLNQNGYAADGLYAYREPYTGLLLGPQYCLLRREFNDWKNWERQIPSIGRRLLVVMGGSDAENLTSRVLDTLALPGFESLEATVVVGGSSPHLELLRTQSAQLGARVTLLSDVSNVAELMATADLAISGAGCTCWELCRMGLPALLIDVAPNQTRVAKDLDRRGCAIYVGDPSVTAEQIAGRLRILLHSGEMRHSLSQRTRQLVDGNGARRVFAALCGKPAIWLRRARPEDSRLLWEWANDAAVRAASFSSSPIAWEIHIAWLGDQIEGQKSLLLIAEDENEIALGQVRFDLKADGGANLNISLAKEKRGCGLALPVINAGIRELFSRTDIASVHAFVKTENLASARAFEKAGFFRAGMERVHECDAIHFVLRRTEPA